MTDKELLSALSDMLDTKLTPIREDLEGLKAETGISAFIPAWNFLQKVLKYC